MTLDRIINIGLVISLLALILNIVLVLTHFKGIEKFPIGMASTTAFLLLMKAARAKRDKKTPLV